MKQTGTGKPNQLERISSLEETCQTLSMGVRVSQMLVKQLTSTIQDLQEQIHIKSSMLNDFQYRLLALQKHSAVEQSVLQKEVDALRLVDWNIACEQDSKEKELYPVEQILDANDIVVFTSSTPESPVDRGIFRSKVKVSALGPVEVIQAFDGKKVGDKFEVSLAETKHLVEILQILKEPKKEEV
jgi:hypothetical protein